MRFIRVLLLSLTLQCSVGLSCAVPVPSLSLSLSALTSGAQLCVRRSLAGLGSGLEAGAELRVLLVLSLLRFGLLSASLPWTCCCLTRLLPRAALCSSLAQAAQERSGAIAEGIQRLFLLEFTCVGSCLHSAAFTESRGLRRSSRGSEN